MNSPGPLLSVDGLFKDFKGVPVINGISLSVSEGERHAVIGPNGAGKTTLFNLITGKYAASKGKITFQNTDITKIFSNHQYIRRINGLGECPGGGFFGGGGSMDLLETDRTFPRIDRTRVSNFGDDPFNRTAEYSGGGA
jgi:energy-coupling factor transporter ATP-binding protein EcfA2